MLFGGACEGAARHRQAGLLLRRRKIFAGRRQAGDERPDLCGVPGAAQAHPALSAGDRARRRADRDQFHRTTDGREGWTQLSAARLCGLRRRAARARPSSYQPDTDGSRPSAGAQGAAAFHRAGEVQSVAAGAAAQQWPGTGMAGDPNFDQFFASQVPFVQNEARPRRSTATRWRRSSTSSGRSS